MMAVILGLGLFAVAGRYGYSRDELYFLECGRHLAWGYPDQPPLVPLVARAMSSLAANSVIVLRLPAILASVAEVVLTGLIARELGGGRRTQILSAAAMAVSAIVLATGHLLETITLALPLWALLIWLIQRTLRTHADRLWLGVGAVAGVALMESDLVAGLLGAIIVGLLVTGPRRVFQTPWFYAGVIVACAIWSPYLLWQAVHGWPEVAVAGGISAGQSGTSTARWLVLPLQLGLVSVTLAPVWIAGLVRLFRGRDVMAGRAWGIAYGVLAVAIVLAGGKEYYLAGMFPILLAAGAPPVLAWGRRRWVIAAVVLSLPNAVFTLPVLPVQDLHHSLILAANATLGESVGWPSYVHEIAAVYRALPPATRRTTIILASNYGEAGAVDHFGPADGLPAVYSGHMSYWYWGPPPATATTVVAVGLSRAQLTPYFGRVRLAAHLNNHVQVADEEQGRPVWVCSARRESWSLIWPHLQNFG